MMEMLILMMIAVMASVVLMMLMVKYITGGYTNRVGVMVIIETTAMLAMIHLHEPYHPLASDPQSLNQRNLDGFWSDGNTYLGKPWKAMICGRFFIWYTGTSRLYEYDEPTRGISLFVSDGHSVDRTAHIIGGTGDLVMVWDDGEEWTRVTVTLQKDELLVRNAIFIFPHSNMS